MELRAREREFTDFLPVRTVVVTYNVAGVAPDVAVDDRASALFPSDADVLCVCLQEIDMSASAVLWWETDVGSSWLSVMQRTLGSAHSLLRQR